MTRFAAFALFTIALIGCARLGAQTPTCVIVAFSNGGGIPATYACEKPSTIGLVGPAGPQGVPGPVGPTGPQGPAGTGTGITGGPCTSASGQLTFMVKLPDNTCLPVVIVGANPLAMVPGKGSIIAGAGVKTVDGKPIAEGRAIIVGAVKP